MIKKLCILFLSVLFVAPLVAQQENGKDNASFRPKKGDWQVSLHMGKGQFFNEIGGMNYLLPKQYVPGASVGDLGLSGGETPNQSGDPGLYLDLGSSFNDNSVINIASFQGAYFLTERWQLTATFTMDLSRTPKKDYLESSFPGYEDEDPLALPNYKYIEGRLSNKWMASVGGNYYFDTKNERISLYGGALAGFQMARIRTSAPYTGELVQTGLTEEGEPIYDPVELYRAGSRVGSVWGLRGALVAGIDFSLMPGLLLGFEVQPFSYNYAVMRIQPKGLKSYDASFHNMKVFSFPTLKLGIRF